MCGRGLGNASASASGSSGTGSPSTRTAIGWQSGLPSASRASPRRPGDGGDQRASGGRGGQRRRIAAPATAPRGHADRPRAEAEAGVDAAGDRLVHRSHQRRARPDRPEHAAGDRLLDRADPTGRLAQLVEAERGQRAELVCRS